MRAFGEDVLKPTVVFSDGLSSAQVTSLEGTATKMKHMLRHIHTVMARVLSGENLVRHVPGEEMPGDFLTKWVSGEKAKQSVAYLTNSRALE